MSRIDELMIELSNDNFSCPHLTAYFVNEVLELSGCDKNLVVDQTIPGDDEGSNLLRVLMYQNLLLAKRIDALEK